jgi:hypothetical protein
VTLADVVRSLRDYAEQPAPWQEPTIYSAEPWRSSSEALVAWGSSKGGLPEEAARRGLVRLIEVRAALRLLGRDFDTLVRENRIEDLCSNLIARVKGLNEGGQPYLF